MPQYDFGEQLTHRTGALFTTSSIGLDVPGLWNDLADYNKPLQMGTLFELLLLYTVDRKTQQRQPPHNVLSEEDKRNRFALSYKIRDNKAVELEPSEVTLLKLAVSVLSTEPNVLCHQFLDSPEV